MRFAVGPGDHRPLPLRIVLAAALGLVVALGASGGVPPVASPQERAAPGVAPFAFSTFLGGAQWDEAYDLAVDWRGSAYVTGLTFSTDLPRTGAGRSSFRGVVDAFVARYAPGGTLLYRTYLGGERFDVGHGIAVDRAGNAYVTGRTRSGSFPTRGALQPRLRGRNCQRVRCFDAFVTKLDPRGAIVYSTYLGGATSDEGFGIAVDAAGSAYVTGNTDSADFPTRNAVQSANRSRPCRGDTPCPLDVFVTKLSPNGRAIEYSTYLGGTGTDTSGAIAVDRAGNAYLTGTTRSSDFPVRSARQDAIGGTDCGPTPETPCLDAFVTKLSASGRALSYSTYLGGKNSERGGDIAVDARGRAHVTGATQSTDFPTVRAVQPSSDNSSCRSEPPAEELCDDAFVSGFSASGRTLTFSTYLGGNGQDQGLGIAVDRRGGIHVAGTTDSRTFPTRNALQPRLGGAVDAFAARLSAGGGRLVTSSFLGSAKNERANAIALGADGRPILAGRTESPAFPSSRAAQGTLAGDYDAFVTRLR